MVAQARAAVGKKVIKEYCLVNGLEKITQKEIQNDVVVDWAGQVIE